MAIAKHARLVAATELSPRTRLLDLQLEQPLEFVGGQYIIVDSGEMLPNGKSCKRAYSILSSDAQQTRVRLAAYHLESGPGSSYLHRLAPDAPVTFSGPWGKFQPLPQMSGPSLVLSTDTGVTAALGLIRSKKFEAAAGATIFVWLRTSSAYFLPEAFVREQLPARLRVVRMEALPPIGHPERVPYVVHVVGELRRRIGLSQGYLVGDGAINQAVSEDLVQAGMASHRCLGEAFFNGVRKSA